MKGSRAPSGSYCKKNVALSIKYIVGGESEKGILAPRKISTRAKTSVLFCDQNQERDTICFKSNRGG